MICCCFQLPGNPLCPSFIDFIIANEEIFSWQNLPILNCCFLQAQGKRLTSCLSCKNIVIFLLFSFQLSSMIKLNSSNNSRLSPILSASLPHDFIVIHITLFSVVNYLKFSRGQAAYRYPRNTSGTPLFPPLLISTVASCNHTRTNTAPCATTKSYTTPTTPLMYNSDATPRHLRI